MQNKLCSNKSTGNTNPVVTVIMPAFNAVEFIEKALISITQQNIQKTLEILVVDDGSTDGTVAIVQGMARKYPSIRLIKNSRRKGPSGARNEGLLAARGQYIAFLDADDEFLPNHLLRGVEFLDRNLNIDMVMFNFDVVFYKNKIRRGDWTSEKKHMTALPSTDLGDGFIHVQAPLMPALLQESFLHLQATMIRKKFMEGVLFNESLSRSEDRDLAIRLDHKKKIQFAYSAEITGIYYLHENSLTSPTIENSIATIENGMVAFQEYMTWKDTSEKALLLFNNLLHDRHLELAYLYRQQGKQKMAFKNIRKAGQRRFSLRIIKETFKTMVYVARSSLSRNNK